MTLDEHAATLLHMVVLPLAEMVHEGDIFDADRWLQRYDDTAMRQIIIMLAALVDPTRPWQDALGWWLDKPGDIQPLHADQRYESPRPLILERAA